MKIRNASGLLACLLLLASTLLSGCGGSSSNTTIPSTATIFYAHTAIFRNHSTYTMGYNGFGQLGLGDLATHAVATKVAIGSIDGVATGGDHTIAYSSSNQSSVYTWGSNYYGQLGDPTRVTTGNDAFASLHVTVPLHNTQGDLLTPGLVTSVAAGWFHSLAVVDGTVFSWGYNGYGQLGDRDNESTLANGLTPKQVRLNGSELNNIVQVAAGGGHSLALTANGRVYAWGDNSYGELGSNPANINNLFSSTPQLVNDANGVPLTGVLQIAAGGSTSYALLSDGTVWAWGYNGMGQLGRDPAGFTSGVSDAFSYKPVHISLTTKAVRISAGLDHAIALMDDKTVTGWGFNQYGQLGNGTTGPSNGIRYNLFPVAVTDQATNKPLAEVTEIVAFGNQSLVRVGSSPGTWYGCGDNGYGQLGNPIATSTVGFQEWPKLVGGL